MGCINYDKARALWKIEDDAKRDWLKSQSTEALMFQDANGAWWPNPSLEFYLPERYKEVLAAANRRNIRD